jgi:hypothetical protein
VIGNAMPPSEQVERIDVDAPAHTARFGQQRLALHHLPWQATQRVTAIALQTDSGRIQPKPLWQTIA